MKYHKLDLFVAALSFWLYLALSGNIAIGPFKPYFDLLQPAKWFLILTSLVAMIRPAWGCLGWLMEWFGGRQFLVIRFPLPVKLDMNEAVLILDGDDLKIYEYLIGHGRSKKTEEGLVVRYRGKRIYSRSCRNFDFGGDVLKPKTATVLTDRYV